MLHFCFGNRPTNSKPVAIVCTSGSAVLNYYPAGGRSFYSQIPLVVISADRPQSKIDIGDGQTIRQENVFANHSLYNANLQENVSTENDNHIQMAFHVAVAQKASSYQCPLKNLCMKQFTALQVQPEIVDFNIRKTFFIR